MSKKNLEKTVILSSLTSGEGLHTLRNHAKMNKLRLEEVMISIYQNPEELVALHIINLMNQYQQQNQIKNECSTNTQYLYDCIRESFPHCDIKVKAVGVFFETYENQTTLLPYNGGHVVVIINKKIFDPSYEISSQDGEYFQTLKEVGDNKFLKLSNKNVKRVIINKFLEFQKMAEEKNKGEVMVSNREYYDQQADFIDNQNKALHTQV